MSATLELNAPAAATNRRPSDASASELKATARRLAEHCATFKGASLKAAYWQLLSTSVAFTVVIAAMLASISYSYLLTVMLAFPAAGLLVRFFIIQHDCGHGSFLPSRQENDTIGRLMSVLTLTPYGLWRREHAQHHASSGNLDRRGVGDINTLTVKEYQALPWYKKAQYRIYRNPLFLFGFGLPFYFLVLQRLPWFHPYPVAQTWGSVMRLNLGLAIFYGPLMWIFGWDHILMVALPILALASALGGWLFFVQHQFEGTHWEHTGEWDFQVAAIYGSSYYVLPKVLQWFTGNIGLHHIHHVCSMVPNYKLQACLDASPELKSLNRVTFWQSLSCPKLALWDEASRRLISFREMRSLPAA